MAQQQALSSIIERLAIDASSEEAWVDLFRQLYPFVIAALYRKMRGLPTSSLEDCAQEVFIRLLKTKPFTEILDADAFRSYVWRTAENVANTQIASYRTTERHRVDYNDDIHALTETKDTFDGRDLAIEQILKVSRALVPEDRTLLKLLLSGRTLGEISGQLGVNYGTVGVRAHRLKAKLGKLLKSNEEKKIRTPL